nr:fibronectin type III domain-containing protein [Bacteroidales bacterium]
MKKILKRMLLAAVLCVPWVTQGQTDTLTVADGTNTNYNIPFYGSWMDADQHNQVIYPASMTANIVGDSITGIGFYMSSTNSTAWGAPVTIRLGITSDAALTGIDNNTVLTQVWQGSVNGQGDIWIQFDSAYAFQGGNLLLDIQTVGASYNGASFYGISQTGASYCSYNGNVYAEDFIPKTSFLHVEGNFEVCLMPTNLVADVDSNQIVVSWDAAADVFGYNVYLNDSLVGQTVSDTFFVFSDLPSNSLYNITVTSVCADGESPAIGGSFRTDCGQMAIPFLANFDYEPYGVFPPCWTRILQSGTDPSVNSVWSHSGTQSMY